MTYHLLIYPVENDIFPNDVYVTDTGSILNDINKYVTWIRKNWLYNITKIMHNSHVFIFMWLTRAVWIIGQWRLCVYYLQVSLCRLICRVLFIFTRHMSHELLNIVDSDPNPLVLNIVDLDLKRHKVKFISCVDVSALDNMWIENIHILYQSYQTWKYQPSTYSNIYVAFRWVVWVECYRNIFGCLYRNHSTVNRGLSTFHPSKHRWPDICANIRSSGIQLT